MRGAGISGRAGELVTRYVSVRDLPSPKQTVGGDLSPKTPVQALKISCADPTPSRTSPVLPSLHNPVGGDLSPKTPVQALKIFVSRPDAFPDESGPTEPAQLTAPAPPTNVRPRSDTRRWPYSDAAIDQQSLSTSRHRAAIDTPSRHIACTAQD